MVAFNTGQTLVFNLGIDVFSGLIALVVYFSFKKDFSDTYENRLLCKLELCILYVLFTDAIMWALDGRPGDVIRVLDYTNNIVYYILQLVAAAIWLKYALVRITGKSLSKRRRFVLLFLPLVAFSALILSSPLNGWCFSLDAQNYYHRGPLSGVLSACALLYMATASVLALMQMRKETLESRRNELRTIAFFALAPLLCGTAQIVMYGLSLVWPSAVLSSLLVLRDKENQAILQDALTGLNNRRNLERFLAAYKNEEWKNFVAVLVLDVNDFKSINDRYGHAAGDAALREMAQVLRIVFNNQPAFLARYGGDEFTVVLSGADERDAQTAVDDIQKSCAAFDATNTLPFSLSVSVGYAVAEDAKADDLASLLRQADEAMYRVKALHHQKVTQG